MGFGKDGKGQIFYERINQALGGLASFDVIAAPSAGYTGNMVEDFRMLRQDYWMTIKGAQATVIQDGPIMVGLAQGELTAAEIEECVESRPINANDRVQLERSGRAVWPLEMFMWRDVDNAQQPYVIKGTINPKWTFNNPQGWTYWVYNSSENAIITGATLELFAKSYGVWVN